MLYVVATPIGPDDVLSETAKKALQKADLVIGEEIKVLRQWLKQAGVFKETRLLNEHTNKNDLAELVELCAQQTVALVSDCGTPNFCDPGADLVRACRKAQIPIKSVAGPSSLTSFLSVCGYRLDQFMFAGFLPKDKIERETFWSEAKTSRVPIIFMDTPYRLERVLSETHSFLPQHHFVFGISLSHPEEQIAEGKPRELLQQLRDVKTPFVGLVLPQSIK